MSLSGHLKDGVHHLDIRVYFEDTDFSGIVYHANYLKFCERGRSDMLRLAGVHHSDLAGDGMHFVVRRMECDFRASARIDDAVCVDTRLKRASGAKLVLVQTVKLAEKVLFEAEVTLALVNGAGRPQRIPPEMMRAMSQA
ncbi:tol-pal system-associated acyl-CoA thioesterase [Anderseniella sp. Alg231-50]|uniref:tol-pal system-associated acyl-CoA thioesterase n=1 Tax=Anderseniella sp. Alg231-50 TaxID=1922226 RepID=UPI000D5569D3